MPFDLSALKTPMTQIQAPDPTERIKTIAALRSQLQGDQLRGLQMREAEQRMGTAAQAQQKQAALRQIIQKHGGDIERALPEVMALDPEMGTQLREAQARFANINSQIADRNKPPAPLAPHVVGPNSTLVDASGKTLFENAFKPKDPEPFTLGPGQRRYGPNGEILAEAPETQRPEPRPEPFTLGAGQRRYDANGNLIVESPAAPPAPPAGFTIGPGQQRFDAQGKVIASLPASPPAQIPGRDVPFPKDVEDQQRRTAEARRRPETSNPFRLWLSENPDASITEWLALQAAQPTSSQKDKTAASGKVRQVLDGIAELSEKINTGSGLLAKAVGVGEKLAAKANYDDDVAEYQAIVTGFVPLVARAAGHTGVLTQQDVDSVKALFPAPGDSKTLRDRKVARVEQILGGGAVAAPDASLRREQHSASSGQYRHSLDGGKTWLSGRLPK